MKSILLALITFAIYASFAVASDPLIIEGNESAHLDKTLPDGGLPQAIGVTNIEVFRASRDASASADGLGWTYNHHVDMAAWKGRLYIAWENGEKDEDTFPARELFSSSGDGIVWNAPAELFPAGIGNPLRMYFYESKGRLLAIAGRRVTRDKISDAGEGGIVVREIYPDQTLGPVFALAVWGSTPNTLEMFDVCKDTDFVAACQQLLADHTFLEQQDAGELLQEHRMAVYQSAPKDFGKAFCFFHRKDGTLVGISKKGYFVESNDDGQTWGELQQLKDFHAGTAKEWVQQTRDGNYAWVHDPFPAERFPLVVMHGEDGIQFGDMRVVHGEVPRQRYAGLNKNVGPQYVRGVSLWGDDGTWPDRAMWLAYSVNKEDIWVSRVPVPVQNLPEEIVDDRFNNITLRAFVPKWNLYRAKWADVSIVNTPSGNCLDLEDHDPYDYASASRSFATRKKVTAEFEVMVNRLNGTDLQIELWSEYGDLRPVRIALSTDDRILAETADHKNVTLGHFAIGEWNKITIIADANSDTCDISVNGRRAATNLKLCESTDGFSRFVLRTGDYRTLPIRGNQVPPHSDRPIASSEFQIQRLSVK